MLKKSQRNGTSGIQMVRVILNPGSLSSEDFLIWACLIEKESSYLQLGGPALMLQQML